jgi:hypothetical protein
MGICEQERIAEGQFVNLQSSIPIPIPIRRLPVPHFRLQTSDSRHRGAVRTWVTLCWTYALVCPHCITHFPLDLQAAKRAELSRRPMNA